MIQLIHSTEANACASKIYLIETNATQIAGLAAETVAGFQSSDKKFDYFKSPEGFTFLVKTEQKAEEIRVLGNTIEGLICDSEEGIQVIGSNHEALFALSEGLLLSSYRFTQHFSKPKNYTFKHIFVDASLTIDQLNELTSMSKAVFWTRDMVNTPV
jgi:leucyl aminopeptidase